MRRILASPIIALIIMVIGLTIGSLKGEDWLAVLIASIAVIMIGFFLRYGLDDWILSIATVIAFILFYLAAQPYGVAIAVLFSVVTFYITILPLLPFFQGSRSRTFNYLIDTLFGRIQELQIVEPPSKSIDKNISALIGPRTILIRPDTAVVLEQGPRQTRVSGPALLTSNQFEFVSKAYSLKAIHRSYEFNRVHTSDLIEATISTSITFGLDIALDACQGRREITDQEARNIEYFHDRPILWEDELRDVTEASTREVIGEFDIEHALMSSNHPEIGRRVQFMAQQRASAWGIEIFSLDIVSIQPAGSNASRVREDHWLTKTRSETLKMHEEARGEAWRLAIGRLAEGYEEVRDQGLPDAIIYRELLRRMFEQALSDPATSDLVPPELGHMLSDTRENLSD